MAKPLVFQFGDRDIAFALDKVDRSRLYGYKETLVVDERGRPCELATLARDGQTVIGRGGTALGYLNVDGAWCDKSSLSPVDAEGRDIQAVPSSYSAPVKLFETVSVDEYLQHNIRSVYLLACEDEIGDLLQELRRGTIFSFPYSFRGGLEADSGFLLMGADDHLFLAVGAPTRTEYVGLQTPTIAAEDTEEEDETELMDFDMI